MITPPIALPPGGRLADQETLLDAADTAVASDGEGDTTDGEKRIVVPVPTRIT